MITTKNLCKSFDENTHVLKGISETINKGEKVVVIGPSGSGKSTFLRCLNLLETPTQGEIWFEGENITDPKCDIQKIRQKTGMVFQQFNLFPHMTVLQNITFAPVKLGLMNQQDAEKKARELLSRIGLADKENAYPAQLSGGQKQRVAVAVSMICGKDLLVFDEPTSGLDFDSMAQVAGLIKRLSEQGKIIFIVTHDFEFVCRTCSRVLHFDEGEMPDDIPVVMDSLQKLRELFSVSERKEM